MTNFTISARVSVIDFLCTPFSLLNWKRLDNLSSEGLNYLYLFHFLASICNLLESSFFRRHGVITLNVRDCLRVLGFIKTKVTNVLSSFTSCIIDSVNYSFYHYYHKVVFSMNICSVCGNVYLYFSAASLVWSQVRFGFHTWRGMGKFVKM